MNMNFEYQNYTPFIDECAVAFSLIYAWLLSSTYTMRKLNLTLFRLANYAIIIAAWTRIIYHMLLDSITEKSVLWIYICRDISCSLLILVLMCFCTYLGNQIDISKLERRLMIWGSGIIWFLYTIWEILTPITKLDFYIDENLKPCHNFFINGFNFTYSIYIIMLFVFMVKYKKKFISSMYRCIIRVFILCMIIVVVGAYFRTSSYFLITFSFPIMVILFLFHSNSYDPDTGTLDDKAFNIFISDLKSREFTMVCLRLEDMKQNVLDRISSEIFHFNESYFKDSCIFRFGNDKLILVYEKSKNVNAVFTMQKLMEKFEKLYEKYQIDYKMITIHSSPELKAGEEYLLLDEFLEQKVKMNTWYECTHDDVVAYLNAYYIITELHNIVLGNDLDDERVLVYCQPVYNADTKTFTTAEALMRLELKETGMVFPEEFIPLAEKYDYIHFLSMIILNKTCKKIKQLMDDGYIIDRISVNFAMSELRDAKFCNEIKEIISSNDISYDKVALELTESMNESEFSHVQSVMSNLHEVGMKLYLDDFGTGYSSFERIMKLPIDIIKFDRSLTIMAVNDKSSRDMVVGFTDIFRKANYNILFEGIENETDEKKCIEMNAMYLQGYKYSRPIPIDALDHFLKKRSI